MKIFSYIEETITKKGAGYFILIDPDKVNHRLFPEFINKCVEAGVDGFLIGGSLMMHGHLENTILLIKKYCSLPVIIFPGTVNQVNKNADALLFISLISGRNPEYLFGKHVMAAPLIKQSELEVLSTGYMLIESGKTTTVQYMSNSNPIPRNKPEIALATALAAQYIGMKMVYLEAGSGADNAVPNEMVKLVSSNLDIPVIVGGGIKDSKTAREKVENGAKIIVTGNYFENDKNWHLLNEFSQAVHYKSNILV